MKSYIRLREALKDRGLDHEGLAIMLGLSRQSVTARLTGRIAWRIDEAYIVLDLLECPYSEFPVWFPPNGDDRKIKQASKVVADRKAMARAFKAFFNSFGSEIAEIESPNVRQKNEGD